MSFTKTSIRFLVGCWQSAFIFWSANALAGSAEELAALNQQTVAAYQQGRYAQALSLATSALRVAEESFGPEHQITIQWLDSVGGLCLATHDYPGAVSIYEQAGKVREKVFGPDSPEVVVNLNSLAGARLAGGHLAQAESVYRKMLMITDRSLGVNSRYAALSALRLAEFYVGSGRYADAEPFYARALAIFEKTSGPEHLDAIGVMNGLAEAYRNMGDYAKAEPFYRRALGLAEKNPEAGVQTAALLSCLGAFYLNIGDYAQAESSMQQALKLQEQLYGPEHREVGAGLNNLATLYATLGAYKRAEPLCERALQLTEKISGPDSAESSNARQNLARIYMQTQRSAEAEPLFRRVLTADERLLGFEHPATSATVESLAILSHERHDFTNAETFYRRAMTTDERVLGLSHRQTLIACGNLCCLMQDIGRSAEARTLASKTAAGQTEEFANILSFASEKQRLAYQTTCQPYSLFAALSAAPPLALAILRNKCVVLDSLLEDRRMAEASTNADDHALVERITKAKQELNRLLSFGPADAGTTTSPARTEARRKKAVEIEQLEGGLARRVTGLGNARQALRVTVEQVQRAIPTNAALIECVRYLHYLGFRKAEYRYGAAIVTGSGEPRWVCLGSAEKIEKNILLYQQSVRSDLQAADASRLGRALLGLYQQVWAPIESVLPAGTKTIILSPDDRLNFLSFATLLTPGDQFLAQKYSIRYVTSGRDLLRVVPAAQSAEMVIFAAPAYASRQSGKPKTTGLYLAPLPELATNAAALASTVKKWNWPVQLYLGAAATEKQLQAIRSPHILHLSTHGFFLPAMVGSIDGAPYSNPFAAQKSATGVALVNPMRRSGVALAGAQDTLEAWEHGKIMPTGDDGILTAEEAGGLHLAGTWLVTLAACDTGVGAPVAGEGVMGLRRGFIQAGVQNLLLTLWPVAVTETDDFMSDFFSAVHENGNAPAALANVQRDWLVKVRARQGLLPAVFFAGSFVLNSQGPLQ